MWTSIKLTNDTLLFYLVEIISSCSCQSALYYHAITRCLRTIIWRWKYWPCTVCLLACLSHSINTHTNTNKVNAMRAEEGKLQYLCHCVNWLCLPACLPHSRYLVKVRKFKRVGGRNITSFIKSSWHFSYI